MDNFDDTALCYFAALIHGIRLINEKEAERGFPFGAVPIDADALVHFVRTKGDVLVYHMNVENEKKITRSAHMRWGPNEFQRVAEQCRRLCPDGPHLLREEHLLRAQEVLPPDRRKDKFASNVLTYMRNFIRTGDGRRSGGAKPSRRRREPRVSPTPSKVPAIRGNGQHSEISPAVTLSRADSVSELLATQIATAVIEVSIQALTLAAERLKSGKMG